MFAAVTQALIWLSAGFQGGMALYSVMRAIITRDKAFVSLGMLSAFLAFSGIYFMQPRELPFSVNTASVALVPVAVSSIFFVHIWLFFGAESVRRAWFYRGAVFAFSVILSCCGNAAGLRIGAVPVAMVLGAICFIEVFGASGRIRTHSVISLAALAPFAAYSAVTLPIPVAASSLFAALFTAMLFAAMEFRGGRAGAPEGEWQRKYRGLYEQMRDGVVRVGPDDGIIECNDAFARMAGQEKERLWGMKYGDIITGRWRHRETVIRDNVRSQGVSAPYEQEFRRPDGSVLTVEVVTYPTGPGGPEGFWNIAREISDRKRYEAMWKRYEAIVNTSLDFMVLIDREYRCEAVNDALCMYLNRRREELIGSTVDDFVGQDFFSRDIKPFVDTCFTGNAIYHQGPFVVGNLGERVMDIGFYPYHSGDEITHAIMIAHDITELARTETQLQKAKAELEERVALRTRDLFGMNSILESEILIREQAESELRKSEEKYRQLVETMTDGLFVLQRDAVVAYVNSRMTEMLGYGTGEMIGRPVYDFLNKNNRAVMKEQLAKRRRGSKPPYEIEWVRKNGRKVQTFVSPQILYDEDGRFAGSFGVIKDISSRKAAEAELKKAKETAEKANRSKSEFLASISHEIRTPMNAILGFSELLESRIQEGTQREYIAAIINSGRTLLGIINDILDLSKIEAGKFTFEMSPLSIRGLVREMENIFSRGLREKGLRFFSSIDSSVPDTLSLDGIRVRQVLFNLIGNAVKFTEEGLIRIEASAVPAGGTANAVDLVISVQDTGIGVPESQRDNIFEPFRQRDGQVHSRYGGSGLGLTISRRLVEAMGGGLSLVSEEGSGSTFSITLRAVDVVNMEKAADTAAAGESERRDYNGRTVLIVDDVESNRLLFRVFLKSEGFSVLEAENGMEALEIASAHCPDLILMDIIMPGMSGDEVIELLKDDPVLRRIPVIAVTASMLSDRAGPPGSGYDGYLVKPVNRKQLLREIGRILTPGGGNLVAESRENPGAAVQTDGPFSVPPEIVARLRGDYFTRWEQVRRRAVFDEIELFAADIRSLGVQYSVRPLVEWSEAVLRAVRSFNMEVLPDILDRYEELSAPGPDPLGGRYKQ